MAAPTSFSVNTFLYGSNQERIEADIVIPIDPPGSAVGPDQIGQLAQRSFRKLMIDLKHSIPMTCEACGMTFVIGR